MQAGAWCGTAELNLRIGNYMRYIVSIFCTIRLYMPLALILSAMTILPGCGEVFNQPEQKVVIQVDDAMKLETYRSVLLGRFTDLLPNVFSGVTAQTDSDKITFVFKHGGPTRQEAEFILLNQGHFVARDDSGFIVFTDADVEAATAILSQNSPALAVRLSVVGGNRLAEFTSKHDGTTMVLALDGKELTKSVIRGTLGRNFQTSFRPDVTLEQIKHIALLISHGALPGKLTILRNDLK